MWMGKKWNFLGRNLIFWSISFKTKCHPSKTQTFDRLWGFDSDTTISVVEVYVSKTVKIKGTDFVESLQTLRSVGYILKDANQN